MEHLTFPFGADGLKMEVLIGLDSHATAKLHAAGRPVTRPVRARGLLDTGTDATAVAPWVFRQLGLRRQRVATTHTASGRVRVAVYQVSLTISGSGAAGSPMFVRPTLLVTELAAALSDFDVLVGMDIMSTCIVPVRCNVCSPLNGS
jgi:hypothetical protein